MAESDPEHFAAVKAAAEANPAAGPGLIVDWMRKAKELPGLAEGGPRPVPGKGYLAQARATLRNAPSNGPGRLEALRAAEGMYNAAQGARTDAGVSPDPDVTRELAAVELEIQALEGEKPVSAEMCALLQRRAAARNGTPRTIGAILPA